MKSHLQVCRQWLSLAEHDLVMLRNWDSGFGTALRNLAVCDDSGQLYTETTLQFDRRCKCNILTFDLFQHSHFGQHGQNAY